MGREDEVKLIAYRIWEETGCPDGRDCEHWFQAEAVWEKDRAKKPVEESVKPAASTAAAAAPASKKTGKRKPAPRHR